MPHRDWIWKYYYTDNSKYRNDATHRNAWCQAELDDKISLFREMDKAARYNGEVITERDEKALLQDAQRSTLPLCGKINNLINHLLGCQHASPEVRSEVQNYRAHREEAKKAMDSPGEVSRTGPGGRSLKLSEAGQEEFDRDICDLFVACGFPWNSVTNPILKRFFWRWVPGVVVPSRRTISEHVLLERVIEVEAKAKVDTRGKLAMGQCDGWKNIARMPIVAMLMTTHRQTHVLRVHHVGVARKTAENLLALIKLNLEEAQNNYGIEWIGWCSDAGSDSRKARKLLFEEFPELICPDCWAHQINLVVGDYFKIKVNFIAAASRAQTVIKWFNNHSRALEWLREEQLHSLQKTLSLLYPVLTRWTSVYMALKRLLDSLPAFRGLLNNHNPKEIQSVAGNDKKSREKALEVLDTLNDENFWRDITRISLHLEPLTVAAHITEGASTRLDQVLLTLGNLYRIYSGMSGEDQEIGQALCASLEKRWVAADQNIFILAGFLNPYIRGDLFSLQSGSFLCAGFIGLVTRVWKRLFRQTSDPDMLFLKACSDYYKRDPCSIFSDESMNLAMFERVAHSEEQEVDIVMLWEQIDDTTFDGRNWLVKLAIRVLSVVANSAGCERLFSQMGLIHTRNRSRLNIQRVRDTVVLKNALLREFENEQARSSRLKRKVRDFDNTEPSQGSNIAPGEVEQSGVRADGENGEELARAWEVEGDDEGEMDTVVHDDSSPFYVRMTQRLIDEVIADASAAAELESKGLSGDNSSLVHHQIDVGSFGRPRRTPLSSVFNFSNPVALSSQAASLSGSHHPAETQRVRAPAIDVCWRGGMRNLNLELERMALLQSSDLTHASNAEAD